MTDSLRGEIRLIDSAADCSSRLLLLIRGTHHERIMSVRAELVIGPWRDPGDAHVELTEAAERIESGGLLQLDWVAAKGSDIAAAFIQQKDPE